MTSPSFDTRRVRASLPLIVGAAFAVALSACVEKPETNSFAAADPVPQAIKMTDSFAAPVDNLGFLTANSRLVFFGTLSGQETFRDQRDLIVTRNIFEIKEIILGDYDKPVIELNLLGGSLDGQTLRVSHLPRLQKGRGYIIFTDPARTTYNPITANERGAFLVSADGNAVFTADGFMIVGVEEGTVVTGTVRAGARLLSEREGEEGAGLRPLDATPRVSGNVVGTERRYPAEEKAISYQAFVNFIKRSIPR